LGALAGFHHGPPVVHGIFFEQQYFKRAAGAGVFSTQARGDDAGIIEDEDIARAKVAEEVRKNFMFAAGVGAVEDEEAGLIALRRGLLGDEFGREREIKIGGLHFLAAGVSGGGRAGSILEFIFIRRFRRRTQIIIFICENLRNLRTLFGEARAFFRSNFTSGE
jgi:hypothetical protein